jgi:hypothetical protein
VPIRWITLDELPTPVVGVPGLIFSTQPGVALASDGARYFVKGPDPVTVVAEALGYELARLVGLRVPEWALSRLPGEDGVRFASREKRQRSVDLLLEAKTVADQDEFLATCVAFDVWTANIDRNINNLVAEPVGGTGDAMVELHAIDFEKAEVLRGTSRFALEMRNPREWWPKGPLAKHCSQFDIRSSIVHRITAVTKPQLQQVFAELQSDFDGLSIAWADAGVETLHSRAQRLDRLIQEARHG